MSSDKSNKPHAAEIISRPEHTVSRDNISDAALKVLYRLKKGGYEAYLVGGSVRDLLLKKSPKDFDVATDATPDEVHKLFRNSRVIGRRFRLVHVRFGREIIEVATFRSSADPDNDDHDHEVSKGTGRVLRDNVYGTLEDDVWRRDFTANALYYNIADFSIRDCVEGVADIRRRTLRMLGDPETRYREDPVRMLRAARFAAKLEFTIHPDTAEPLPRLAELLRDVPPARLFDEVCKIFQSGHALEGFRHLRQLSLFRHLYPETDQWLDEGVKNNHPERLKFIEQALRNTDERVAEGRPVTPMFLVGVFLWGPMIQDTKRLREAEGCTELQAGNIASNNLVQRTNDIVFMPKRFSYPMREMLQLQPKFNRTKGKRAMSMLGHPRFRAAYDLMLLRQVLGEVDARTANWWTEIQTKPEAEQARAFGAAKAAKEDAENAARRRPRRRRRKT
ncbi:MAG: polynucleotide adenylyltransferase PcnB [Gammaproteobacteria bacterium]|nr:polynucleotide adenylyltransferase PcnB [Gammaproteobacteria bacterium]